MFDGDVKLLRQQRKRDMEEMLAEKPRKRRKHLLRQGTGGGKGDIVLTGSKLGYTYVGPIWMGA